MRAGEDNYYVYTQSIEFTADKVILALGHQENELTTVEQELADYAKDIVCFILLLKMRRMLYWHLPIYRKTTRCVKRLRFGIFDYLSALTIGRGVFSRQNGRLRYEPSGRAYYYCWFWSRFSFSSSRNNQKGYRKPISLFLTETYLAECRKKDRLQAQSFWVFKKKWNMCITLA